MDRGPGRHQPQCHPRPGHRPGRRPRPQGRRLRRPGTHLAGTHPEKLLPDAKVSLKFEVRRPPLEATPASRALANHGVAIYQELGLPMKVIDRASGGGTDAAFAALKVRGPVIEGMGLSGFGAHSNDAEYIQIPSIVPRLYLAARMIMDVSQDKAPMK
ncbi:M20/M25/M40 family metallo-hydrolase [Achromobacter xylosoxidans]